MDLNLNLLSFLNKMYIQEIDRVSMTEINTYLASLGEDDTITVETLVMIHYAYHHEDDDFDGGLNLLDLLYNKLKNYYEISWDVNGMKEIIRTSCNPEEAYYDLLHQMLTPEMIGCYGI
jgi:hypothetical protein